MEIKEKDLGYEYSSNNYQILYKGQRIGGAGTLYNQSRRSKANRIFFKEQAEITKRDILNGRIEKRFLDEIKKIEKGGIKKCFLTI